MKSFSYAVILLLCFAFSAQAANVYTGCRTPSSTFRHDWYFDPVHGKTQAAGGDGSRAAPWNNLQALIQAEPGYSYPLLTTAPYRHVPVQGQPAVNKTGPQAGPIAPGDEILLMSGNYGECPYRRCFSEDFELRFCDGRSRAGADARPDIAFHRRNQHVGVQRAQGAKSSTRQPQRQRPGPDQGCRRDASDVRHRAREHDHLIPGQRRGLEQSPMDRECAQRVLRPEHPPGVRIPSAFRSLARISAMSKTALRL